MDEVIIKNVCVNKDSIVIFFDSSERIEAWLENNNKHDPNILYINVDNDNKCILLKYQNLCSFIERFSGQVFRLSLCTATKRMHYKVAKDIKNQWINNILLVVREEFFFSKSKPVHKNNLLTEHFIDIQHKNKLIFENIDKLPIDTLSIGTCFSRSIFRSDEYFNPIYKKYFNIKKTIFHNSFISIFSDEIKYDYSKIEDLKTGDAGKYVGIEFKKNIENLLINNDFQLIIVDNYIDATSPIIKYKDNSYLTYNKYMSESIFKRFFSSCEIIYPGSKKHLELYKKSIIAFNNMLSTYDIKNVVLIGGRLSKFKTDEETDRTYKWNDKMEWILSVNDNWDKVDKIFLEVMPNSIYIDKRKTFWKSDIHSPIIGGASPSHYQSGYYKELFEDILKFLSKDFL